MESRAKLLGHPVHQMLVPIPAGLFIVGAVLDIVQWFAKTTWIPTVTYWNLVIGVVAAVVAAVFGLADWTKIPDYTRAKRIGRVHAVSNLLAVALFVSALWIRSDIVGHELSAAALALEVVALILLATAAWLGGELVDRLGVGVDEGAHLDAPNSLRSRQIPSARR
ncbi:MAG TPA: DUF2231 domain-containing protein [Polyangiales bacterium]|nr:DUF2231 domain-containing protein [Polyangiales bacterium]